MTAQNHESDHVIPDGCRDGCEHETLPADGPPVEDRLCPCLRTNHRSVIWQCPNTVAAGQRVCDACYGGNCSDQVRRLRDGR